MPFCRLTLQPALDAEKQQRLSVELTGLIATSLRKKAELTSVLIESPAASLWAVGGDTVLSAAHLVVFVTAGTNSPDEKRAFVAAAIDLLRKAIPALPEASYVVVKELPAVDWGYDGRTQADRAASA